MYVCIYGYKHACAYIDIFIYLCEYVHNNMSI